MEAWKDVVGYEGWYEVSDLGRVKRIKAEKGVTVGRELRSFSLKGYARVKLCKNGVGTSASVARLVAFAFLGLPQEGREANHKNGIKTDDQVENLEWVTPSENMLHAHHVIHTRNHQGAKNPKAKLTIQDVLKIKKLFVKSELTMIQIAKLFNVKPAAISKIATGRSWSHIVN